MTIGKLVEQEKPKSRLKDNDRPKGKNMDAESDYRMTVLESHGYTLSNIIGMGSYATVKLATSQRHRCEVAIKIISKVQAPNDYLKKFLPREIEVVKGLKHPNMIKFLQAIETTHRVYIVMEYAEKGSLLDAIRKEGYIDETKSKKWFGQLVNVIDYCHERGVVHRDIKCENLLISGDFTIKLSDFGFARNHMRYRTREGFEGSSLSQTFCGSYAYASPEILKGTPYDPQLSDVWSMGVVLFAMLYGRLPFDDTKYSQLLKQVTNKVMFPKEPSVSAEAKTLITRILAPIKSRLGTKNILEDPWVRKSCGHVSPYRLEVGDSAEQGTCPSEETSYCSSQTVTDSVVDRKFGRLYKLAKA